MQQHDNITPFDRWSRPIEDIDEEIGQLSVACGVYLLEPGVIERLLHNDTSVCDHGNQRAFDKLRQLVMMHYIVTERTVEALGAEQTQVLTSQIIDRLRPRFERLLHKPSDE
jgi:hypothetical protein